MNEAGLLRREKTTLHWLHPKAFIVTLIQKIHEVPHYSHLFAFARLLLFTINVLAKVDAALDTNQFNIHISHSRIRNSQNSWFSLTTEKYSHLSCFFLLHFHCYNFVLFFDSVLYKNCVLWLLMFYQSINTLCIPDLFLSVAFF